MEITSPYTLIKQLEAQVRSGLSGLDLMTLPLGEQKVLEELRQALVDARLTAQDYELSETRDMQLKRAKEAKQLLRQAEKGILTASHHDVFGPVEVAHLSANIERAIGHLQ